MTRDVRAAMYHDFYIGMGNKSRRCHEEELLPSDRKNEWLMVFSMEEPFSIKRKVYACRYKGHHLRPITKEDYMDTLDTFNLLRNKELKDVQSIQNILFIRYDPEEYLELQEKAQKKRRSISPWAAWLWLERYAFVFFLMIMMMCSAICFILGSSDGIYVGGRAFCSVSFYFFAPILTLLNGVLSMHDRRAMIIIPLGMLPCTIRIAVLLFPLYPWIIGSVLVEVILIMLIILLRSIYERYGVWYGLEMGRNLFSLVLFVLYIVIIICDNFIPGCENLLTASPV